MATYIWVNIGSALNRYLNQWWLITKGASGIHLRSISEEVLQYAKLTWRMGAVSIRKAVLPGMAIPMLKIRRPNGRLIFNMEIAIRR